MPLVDGSQIQDLKPIAAGKYPATFVSYEFKESNSKKPMDVLKFEIQGSDIPGETAETRTFYQNLTVQDNTLWKFKQTAVALGEPEDTFEGHFDTEEILEGLTGRECRLEIGVQASGDFAGRNEVKRVWAPSFDLDGD